MSMPGWELRGQGHRVHVEEGLELGPAVAEGAEDAGLAVRRVNWLALGQLVC